MTIVRWSLLANPKVALVALWITSVVFLKTSDTMVLQYNPIGLAGIVSPAVVAGVIALLMTWRTGGTNWHLAASGQSRARLAIGSGLYYVFMTVMLSWAVVHASARYAMAMSEQAEVVTFVDVTGGGRSCRPYVTVRLEDGSEGGFCATRELQARISFRTMRHGDRLEARIRRTVTALVLVDARWPGRQALD